MLNMSIWNNDNAWPYTWRSKYCSDQENISGISESNSSWKEAVRMKLLPYEWYTKRIGIVRSTVHGMVLSTKLWIGGN